MQAVSHPHSIVNNPDGATDLHSLLQPKDLSKYYPSQMGFTAPVSQQAGTKKNCNCKNSRCLKLYCECFSSGEYCKNCNCNGCCNNVENESIRKKTVAEVLERNPNAFRPKIAQTGTLGLLQGQHQYASSLNSTPKGPALLIHSQASVNGMVAPDAGQGKHSKVGVQKILTLK